MLWCIVLFVGIGGHWSALFLLFIGGNDKLHLQTLLLPPIRREDIKNPHMNFVGDSVPSCLAPT